MPPSTYVKLPVEMADVWQIPTEISVAATIDIYNWIHGCIGDPGAVISVDTGVIAMPIDGVITVAAPGDWIVKSPVNGSNLSYTFAIMSNADFVVGYQALS